MSLNAILKNSGKMPFEHLQTLAGIAAVALTANDLVRLMGVGD